MKTRATHYMILNSDGSSHLEPMAQNTPKDCGCGCGSKKKPASGRRATTNDLAAIRRGYLARAKREAGTDRAASLGIAADIASVIDKRADGPFAWVQPIIGGEDEAELED